MTDDIDHDFDEQQEALADTIAWDEIYAQACRQAQNSGYAQLILERGKADYELVDGRTPDALKIDRLRWGKIHVILDLAA